MRNYDDSRWIGTMLILLFLAGLGYLVAAFLGGTWNLAGMPNDDRELVALVYATVSFFIVMGRHH